MSERSRSRRTTLFVISFETKKKYVSVRSAWREMRNTRCKVSLQSDEARYFFFFFSVDSQQSIVTIKRMDGIEDRMIVQCRGGCQDLDLWIRTC